MDGLYLHPTTREMKPHERVACVDLDQNSRERAALEAHFGSADGSVAPF